MSGLIITGGSQGIGAATARKAAALGYRVCVNYAQDAQAAGQVVDAIRRDGGVACAVQADVACEADVRRLFAAAHAALGEIGGLVNNAGITGPIGAFATARPETFRRVMDVNVIGTMLCAQEAVRHFLPLGQGKIVNLSSIAATTGAPGEYVHYAASKAAVEALTKGLARELAASGIRVNAVSPGSTLTGIHAKAGEPGRPERVKARVPAGRLAQPDEIAEAIVWLLSDAASYVNGAVLQVTGGA